MKTNKIKLAYSYSRLSVDDATGQESESIANQKSIIRQYCEDNNIAILREFSDDGFSGADFRRPGFQAMIDSLKSEDSGVSLVITKDLSRLGRDMSESSQYAEKYFPEMGIRFITVNDNFDSDSENVLAPIQFAVNEMYLRETSKKIRKTLEQKRREGQYCHSAPYGYIKDQTTKRLIPDERTADVVKQIFDMAAQGVSTRAIAVKLNEMSIVPPLKYKAYYREKFTQAGIAKVSDEWPYTTVKRIIRNEVYLGHTILGKQKNASIKSKKRIKIEEDKWSVHRDTHPPLVSQETFDAAQRQLEINTRKYDEFGTVRKSIFSKIAFCKCCGRPMCSGGSVYKGEREKYWYLCCNYSRGAIKNICKTRIRYVDLCNLVCQEIRNLCALDESERVQLVQQVVNNVEKKDNTLTMHSELKKNETRLLEIDRIVEKLYTDNVTGKIPDDRLDRMVSSLTSESNAIHVRIKEIQAALNEQAQATNVKDDYEKFFKLIDGITNPDELTREILVQLVDRIEIGRKELPDERKIINQHAATYRQEIDIYFRFIGKINADEVTELERAENF